jgi:cathepsin L
LESTVHVGGKTDKKKGLLGLAAPAPRLTLLKHEAEFLFNRWKKQFPEAHPRWEVFLENLERILKHNAQPDKTYEMALNEFGSMTSNEFLATRLGYRRRPRDDEDDDVNNDDTKKNKNNKRADKAIKESAQNFVLRASVALADPPLEHDWEQKGAVTPVKNQGSCGSCWAFSAVAAMESAHFLKTGQLVEFSEQELVSCEMDMYGCQGGLMDGAFDWARLNGGLCTEASYPYTSGTTSARGVCGASTCAAVEGSAPSGFVDVPHNEASLLQALFEHGPLSVAIEADETGFQFYHKGVLTAHCGSKLDHGVLLVGYGVDPETRQAFWRIKNSWGAGWGENGYIRILRGKRWGGSECGIASAASYPIF